MTETNEKMNGADSVSQIEALQKGWSQDDIFWLGQIQVVLQPIALRHGRKLFALTMSAGMISEALGNIMKMGGRYKPVVHAVSVIQQVTNNLMVTALGGNGLTELQVMECKGDIERMMALSQAALKEGQTEPGKIVIAH